MSIPAALRIKLHRVCGRASIHSASTGGFEVRWSAPTLAGFLEPRDWCRDRGYEITGYLWDSHNDVGHLKLAVEAEAALFKLFWCEPQRAK